MEYTARVQSALPRVRLALQFIHGLSNAFRRSCVEALPPNSLLSHNPRFREAGFPRRSPGDERLRRRRDRCLGGGLHGETHLGRTSTA